MSKTLFFKLMNKKYGRAKNLDLARQCEKGNFYQSFSHRIFEKKTLENISVIFTSFQSKIIYMSTPYLRAVGW